MKIKNVLVTGGTGYIGSHTVVTLLRFGYKVTIIDNFSNSTPEVLRAIYKITGIMPKFYRVDLLNLYDLNKIFNLGNFDAIIHFAGYKAVGESVTDPMKYYNNNIVSMINIINMMIKYEVNNLVFSSSATVYGNPSKNPITESESIKPTSPYGKTKAMIESMLADFTNSNKKVNCISLRFFNPLGAYPTGDLGEDPNGIPNNLAPFITQVLIGKINELKVFGDDYNTKDGTCIRDYVHIMDLAYGHVCALSRMEKSKSLGFEAFNLGSGHGYSVFDIIHAFEKVSGKKVKYEVIDRRKGDVPELRADATNAKKLLKWKQTKTLEEMCFDTWNWQKKFPNGLRDKSL